MARMQATDRRVGRPVAMNDAEYSAAAARAIVGKETFSAYMRRLVEEEIARGQRRVRKVTP